MTRTSELLADMAANPPERSTWRTRSGDLNEGHFSPRDDRVRELMSIHKAEASRLLAEADQSRDYSAFEAHVSFTVQNVIEGAVSVGTQSRKAA